MGEALAEAELAIERGERPIAAVAVVDEAMVARAHDRVEETNDPTAHAVVVALREAARRLGRVRLADATIFTTHEPCAMCVGALLASDVEALVYAVAGHARRRGRDGHPAGPAPGAAATDQGRERHPPRRGRGPVRQACRPPDPAGPPPGPTARASLQCRDSDERARPTARFVESRRRPPCSSEDRPAMARSLPPPVLPSGLPLVSSPAERCPSG